MAGRRPRTSVVAVSLCAVLATGACGDLEALRGSQHTVLVTATVTTVTPSTHVQGGVAEDELTAVVTENPDAAPTGALDAVVSGMPGPSGIAVLPVGGRGELARAGSWGSGVAWSTIKVPLAIAVDRVDPSALSGATSAITASDNAAAERLWAALGGGAAASASVRQILVEGGDGVTQVPSTTTRPGSSVFGQSHWSLTDQARFGSELPCLAGADRVVDLMGRVSPDQSWGLGRIPGARFKGGWGPGQTGGYLVRQFGLVPAAGGDVVVAIAVEADSFAGGTAALSRMADALAPLLDTVNGGRC